MLELTDTELEKWKETFANDGIVYTTDEEYKEAINNLVGYFDTLIQIDRKSQPKNS